MREKRFVWKCDDENCCIYDTKEEKAYFNVEVVDLLNEQQSIIEHLTVEKFKENKRFTKLLSEQQATITEYEDFCYNLCMFIIGKDLDDEYKEKYGKEYKIITKWKGCGSDE